MWKYIDLFFIEPLTLLVQIINAMCGGILFATIFIKSKNIYSVIFIHALTDWISLFIANCFIGANSALSMNIDLKQAIVMIIITILAIILSNGEQ